MNGGSPMHESERGDESADENDTDRRKAQRDDASDMDVSDVSTRL